MRRRNAHLFQMLPILLLVGVTMLSNFGNRGGDGRFSFTLVGNFQRTTDTLSATYYVPPDVEEHCRVWR